MVVDDMVDKLKYVLNMLNNRTSDSYTCDEWVKYGEYRIYISRNGSTSGFIDVDEKVYYPDSVSYPLDRVVEKFLKYYGKNKETLLNDVKATLNHIQEKDSNSNDIYTAYLDNNQITMVKTSWAYQDEETILGTISLDDLSYNLKFSNQPWLIQYEIFHNIIQTEILSKIYLYKNENSIKNLSW